MTATLDPPGRPAAPERHRFTREAYQRMADDGLFDGGRVELIDGEVFDMPAMKEPHACGLSLTADAMRAAFPAEYVRVQLPLNLGRFSAPEPDVAVVVGKPRDYTAAPTAALLVVEVADSSLPLDTGKKLRSYAAAGVRDYWVLDVESRRLLVFRDPSGNAYATALEVAEGETVAPLAAPMALVAVADLLP